MDGYLGQIANRGKSENEINPQLGKAVPQGPVQEDPFEQADNEASFENRSLYTQATLNVAPVSTQPVAPDKYVQPTVEKQTGTTTYFDRHIIRVKDEKQTVVHHMSLFPDKKAMPPDITFENNSKKKEKEVLFPSDISAIVLPVNATMQTVHHTKEQSKAVAENQGLTPLQPKTTMEKIIPSATLLNQVVTENKKNQPRLIIGNITVEVVSQKQKVIEKIEKRTIIQSKTVANATRERFIFGLNQL